jgi:hypothetical protein
MAKRSKKLSQAVKNDIMLTNQREIIKQQKRTIKIHQETINNLSRKLDIYTQASNLFPYVVPTNFQIKRDKKHEAVAFALLSDWHVDETVVAAEIGGVNSFNPRICKRRVNKLATSIISLIELSQHKDKINTLYLCLLGDFMSGWIHEDLMRSNSFTPPEAVMRFFDLMTGLIDLILKHTRVKIILSCCVGNHGRITKRTSLRKRGQTNYEWIAYEFLLRWYALQKKTRVKVQLPQGQFTWIKVYGLDIRTHHGDGCRYQGGVLGVGVPMSKAIAQWDKARRADIDVCAHWHERATATDYCINGSLIGYSTISEWLKTNCEPPKQSYFIIHPEYGKTGEYPIVLEKMRGRR